MLDVFLSTAAGSVKAVRAGSDGGPGAFISTEAVVMRGFKALRNLYLKEVNIIQTKNCFGEQVLSELQGIKKKKKKWELTCQNYQFLPSVHCFAGCIFALFCSTVSYS